MLPLLVNKVLTTLWPPRVRPSVAPRWPRGFGRGKKRINLALQGGGAHGAFTWGVLDQLLADGRLVIDAISGASAGAVNGVMLADGLVRGGPEEARARLADFWQAASVTGRLPALQRGVVERLFSLVPQHGSPLPWFDALSRFWSPHDLNPLNINPLKDLIERYLDFDAIRASRRELFVSATNVRSGEMRVFTREEMSAEVVMASACIPFLFRAVEIDGAPYWDGGYTGNPTILPFLRTAGTEDVLVVQINPHESHGAPSSAREIANRVHEISFNASLLAELRAVDLIGRLIDDGRLPLGGEYRRLRVHRIVMDDGFDASSRLKTDYEFFDALRQLGQRAARRFLDAHFGDIGRRSTIGREPEARAEVA